MKRYLVMGASGFIGRTLLTLLQDAGVHVAGLYQWGEPTPEEPIEVLRGDVTDVLGLHRTISSFRPDVLIYLAGFIDIEGADPHRLLVTNSLGFLYVLEAARQGIVGRVVWASSVMVYGPSSLYRGKPVTEQDPVQPGSAYGASKFLNEVLAQEYSERFGIQVAGLRFTTVYGPGRWRRGAAGFLVDIAEAARFREPRVVAHGDRNLDLVYVSDAATACMLAAQGSWSGAPVFNIGGGTATVREVVKVALDLRPRLQLTVTPGGQNPWTERVDWSLATSTLGYLPNVSLQDGIRRLLEDAECERRKSH